MSRAFRRKRTWIAVMALVTLGAIVPWAMVGNGDTELTVTPYSDVIRFEARGVASLQVQIYDLSGRFLWDSGVVSGGVVDWDRTDQYGERLAYGTYLYLVQGWGTEGSLILKKTGKLVLLPGDKVQLQAAPEITGSPSSGANEFPGSDSLTLEPLTQYINEDLVVYGNITQQKAGPLYTVRTTDDALWPQVFFRNAAGDLKGAFTYKSSQDVFTLRKMYDDGVANERTKLELYDDKIALLGGPVGIGTSSPAGQVHIQNNVDQPSLRIEASVGTNLIEAYNIGSGTATGLVFRVERSTGDVHATGAFYGAGFYTGSADVAEHINVSEPVEPGDVVEIDPNNPGKFRKARGPYSRLVAGVISANPGVTLGSAVDPVEGKGNPRPMLALAGRVRVKATTENGPIHVGDLLVAASKPGYAMKCDDPPKSIGAVIGKALEPLEDGEGLILIQVTLR